MRTAWLVMVLAFAAPAGAQQIVITGPLLGASALPGRHRAFAPRIHDELEVFQRVGFAWVVPRRAGVLSSSIGVTYVLTRLARDWSLTVALDVDDRRDPVCTTSFGAGLGLLFAPEDAVALAFDVVGAGDWDGTAGGAGLSARITLTPLPMSVRAVDRCEGGPVQAFIASALSVWALARVDWVASPNGGATLAFGASIDLMHALVDPIVQVARSDWHRCTRTSRE